MLSKEKRRRRTILAGWLAASLGLFMPGKCRAAGGRGERPGPPSLPEAAASPHLTPRGTVILGPAELAPQAPAAPGQATRTTVLPASGTLPPEPPTPARPAAPGPSFAENRPTQVLPAAPAAPETPAAQRPSPKRIAWRPGPEELAQLEKLQADFRAGQGPAGDSALARAYDGSRTGPAAAEVPGRNSAASPWLKPAAQAAPVVRSAPRPRVSAFLSAIASAGPLKRLAAFFRAWLDRVRGRGQAAPLPAPGLHGAAAAVPKDTMVLPAALPAPRDTALLPAAPPRDTVELPAAADRRTALPAAPSRGQAPRWLDLESPLIGRLLSTLRQVPGVVALSVDYPQMPGGAPRLPRILVSFDTEASLGRARRQGRLEDLPIIVDRSSPSPEFIRIVASVRGGR